MSIPLRDSPQTANRLLRFPLRIGMMGAGVVVAVGSHVKNLKVGDGCYGLHMSRPMGGVAGWCSEYAVTRESLLLIKPPHISFVEASTLLGSVLTAYQCIKRGLELSNQVGGNLEGKTVFVPGALSTTGSVGVQMVKKVYGASKVISTVSTPKMGLVEQRLPGIVDQLIDYKTQNVVKEVGKGKVYWVYNTQWGLNSTFPIVEPKRGVAMSIASIPTKKLMKEVLGPNAVPFWAGWILDIANAYQSWLLRGTNIQVEFISGCPEPREDLEVAGEMIARQKFLPIFTEVDFNDIDTVREKCHMVWTGKGGLGALIIKIA